MNASLFSPRAIGKIELFDLGKQPVYEKYNSESKKLMEIIGNHSTISPPNNYSCAQFEAIKSNDYQCPKGV